MSSHPGCTMDDAARLALYTKEIGLAPEQVQDFYPTPGTAATVMYYTGIDPFTGKKVYTATDYHEKQLQRALLQWRKPENRKKIREAMDYCSEEGKRDLNKLLGGYDEHRKPASQQPNKNVKRTDAKDTNKQPKRTEQGRGKSTRYSDKPNGKGKNYAGGTKRNVSGSGTGHGNQRRNNNKNIKGKGR